MSDMWKRLLEAKEIASRLGCLTIHVPGEEVCDNCKLRAILLDLCKATAGDINLAKGDHVPSADWDPIPEGQPGSSKSNAYIIVPPDFTENGVPYGAWCRCGACSLVFRSTFAFDCHGKPGEPMKCERCYVR